MERSSSQHKPVCVEDTYINYLSLFNLVLLTCSYHILTKYTTTTTTQQSHYTHCKYYSTLHFEEIGRLGEVKLKFQKYNKLIFIISNMQLKL